jgi:hypothetical protein
VLLLEYALNLLHLFLTIRCNYKALDYSRLGQSDLTYAACGHRRDIFFQSLYQKYEARVVGLLVEFAMLMAVRRINITTSFPEYALAFVHNHVLHRNNLVKFQLSETWRSDHAESAQNDPGGS